MVLLFGGRRLLRAAWFPVLLMWAVIPVPQTFSRYVDLPLQHIGATVARGFAHLIGAKLSTQDLNILFTPKFGMFIAPGCDGLRGSITLGLVAIVVAYVYRFRWYIFAPVVIGAVLLGYVFNLLRLCSLVIYDRTAVTFPALQAHEQLADHIVGGCLFLIAAFLFFTLIEKLRRTPEDVNAAPAEEKPSLGPAAVPYLAKVMAILVLSAVFGLEALHTARVEAQSATNAATPPPMPQHIGNFSLVRTWSEGLVDGTVVYVWGEYETPDGTHVSLGISPELGVHDAEVCHIARGENPTWHGQIEVPSAQGALALTAATYNDGQVQKLEASTVCDGGICKQYSQTNQRFTVVYAKPHRTLPLQADTTRPVPVLLKVETSDTSSPVNEVEPKLAAGLQEFLKSADLVGLTVPYSRR
jgi:exosortase J